MQLIWVLFFALVGINFVLLFFTVITAGLHDIKIADASKKLRHKKRTYNPWVTILVPAHNEASVIERCLQSIVALSYKNFDVLVLNDGSTDKTSQIATKFIKKHSLKWDVIDIYPNLGKGGALNYALNNRKLNTLVTVIDADCTIAPDGLSNIVYLFQDKRVMASNANVRINEEPTLLSYFQQIEYIIGYYHKRHNAYTNSEFIVGGQGATYRRSAIKKVGGFKSYMQTEDIDLSLRIAGRGNKQNRLAYAADALIYTEGVPNIKSLYRQRYRWKFGAQQAIFANRKIIFSTHKKYSKLLTWFRLPQSVFGEARLLFDAITLALFVTIALTAQSLWIFFGAWLTLSVYTNFVIAADQHTHTLTKIKLCAINVFLFPLHMGMTVLNIVSAMHMARNWQQLVGIKTVSGSWVSPDRIGKSQLG